MLALGFQIWRIRRALAGPTGPAEALMPRNRREMLMCVPLCINAGFSEELFFRLALPLLIAHVTGSILVGLAASVVIFGLVHAYQGSKGIEATMIAGAFLTYVHLQTGSLVRPILLHIAVDLMALLVRPALIARSTAFSLQR